MSEQGLPEPSRRWVKREKRRRSERERLQKHGASLRRVYGDAIRKRRGRIKKQ